MANYYALPSLTNWNTASGWSTSSGGAGGTVIPGNGDTAIFDANSGSTRNITLPQSLYISNIISTNSNLMYFVNNGGGNVQYLYLMGLIGGTGDMSNILVASGIYFYVSQQVGINSSNTPYTLKPPSYVYEYFYLQGNTIFTGPVRTLKAIAASNYTDGNGNAVPYKIYWGNYQHNAASMVDGGGYNSHYFQGGTLTLNGGGSADGDYLFQVRASTGGVVNWQGGTLTIAVAGQSGTRSFFYPTNDGTGNVYFAGTSTNACFFYPVDGTAQLNNFQIAPGGYVKLSAGFSANTFTVSGTTNNRITLVSSTSLRMDIRSTAAQNRQYFYYVDLTNTYFTTTNIFYGVKCTYNTTQNITPAVIRPNFFDFL